MARHGREDYVEMAKILKLWREDYGLDLDRDGQLSAAITRRIADMYARDNAAFDYQRFYAAAGMVGR